VECVVRREGRHANPTIGARPNVTAPPDSCEEDRREPVGTLGR
jgi:hypothetical protein